jgi:hypothetical protein
MMIGIGTPSSHNRIPPAMLFSTDWCYRMMPGAPRMPDLSTTQAGVLRSREAAFRDRLVLRQAGGESRRQ